jgi:hypothetical protein
MFPAYGAQTVHMPFGSVYTSLQTGVVDVAENGVNVYLANKHYEVAPVLSMTEHEANNSFTWVSDKLWNSLSSEQKGWVQAAADEVNRNQPAKAVALEHESATKLKSIGVKIVADVDKSGFQKIADPYLDKMSAELGPHATKVKDLIRGIAGAGCGNPKCRRARGRPRRPTLSINPLSCPALCWASMSCFLDVSKTWMAGTSPAMTACDRSASTTVGIIVCTERS